MCFPQNRWLALWLLIVVLDCGRAADSAGGTTAAAQGEDPFRARRAAMVREQIQARGVSSKRVLEAMRQIPRHRFIPRELVSEAYNDHPLPIAAGQTISQPYIVAFMTELLDAGRDDQVLEIGTGSGYQAAVLSLLAKRVYSIEIVPQLGEQARTLLGQLGHDNVEVRIGNGYLGWPEHAPFDRIILTAAPNEVPTALVEQLKAGGRLVAPIGPVYSVQQLIVLDKTASGEIRSREVLPVRFVPMVERPRN